MQNSTAGWLTRQSRFDSAGQRVSKGDADAIMIDFWLANAKLQATAANIARYSVDGVEAGSSKKADMAVRLLQQHSVKWNS